MYKIVFTKQAKKDYETISKSPYFKKALKLLSIIETNPTSSPAEKLIDTQRTYSRRINVQHRLVYQVFEDENIIVVLRMWTHYGDN